MEETAVVLDREAAAWVGETALPADELGLEVFVGGLAIELLRGSCVWGRVVHQCQSILLLLGFGTLRPGSVSMLPNQG